MKHTNKTLALVLVLVLMLTSVASVFAYSAKVYTSGGKLNIWSEPDKIGKGKDYIIASVKNGTDLDVTPVGKNKDGVKYGYVAEYGGYVRMGYIAKVEPSAIAKNVFYKDYPVDVKVLTSGGPVNIWTDPDKIGEGKVYILDSYDKGDEIVKVQYLKQKQANGKFKNLPYAAVLGENDEILGYVATEYIYASPAAKKAAAEAAAVEAVEEEPPVEVAEGEPVPTPEGEPEFVDYRPTPKAKLKGGYYAKVRSGVTSIAIWSEPNKISCGRDYQVEKGLKPGTALGWVDIWSDKDHKFDGYGEVYNEDWEIVGYVNLDYIVRDWAAYK